MRGQISGDGVRNERTFREDCSYKIGRLKAGQSTDSVRPEFQPGARTIRGERIVRQFKCSTLGDLFDRNPLGLKEHREYVIYEVEPTGDMNYFGQDTVIVPPAKPPRRKKQVGDGPASDGLGDDIVLNGAGSAPMVSLFEHDRATSDNGARAEGRANDGRALDGRITRRDAMELLYDQLNGERAEKGELIQTVNRLMDQNQQVLSQNQTLIEQLTNVSREHMSTGQELARTQAVLEMKEELRTLERDLRAEARAEAKDQTTQAGGLSGLGLETMLPHFAPALNMLVMKLFGVDPATALAAQGTVPPAPMNMPPGAMPQSAGPPGGMPQGQPVMAGDGSYAVRPPKRNDTRAGGNGTVRGPMMEEV